MSRTEFLRELAKRLGKLPKDERESVLAYYSEYFDEAGAQNEALVIRELGSPSQMAAMIMSDYAIKDMEARPDSVRKGASAIKYLLRGLIAMPLFPLAVGGLVVILASIIVLFALIFSFYAVVFSLGLAAVASAVCSVVLFFISIPTGIAYIGASLLLAGLCMMLYVPVKAFSAKSLGLLASIMNKALGRGRSHEKI